ncbi:hypothetical protein N183_37615 [Sinorhizobium sp. Sb3]|nr:hypothetical protein N183_37615 [Sinorhizobium sp. Sb3]
MDNTVKLVTQDARTVRATPAMTPLRRAGSPYAITPAALWLPIKGTCCAATASVRTGPPRQFQSIHYVILATQIANI